MLNLSTVALQDYIDGLWWSRDDPEWCEEDRQLFQLSRTEALTIAVSELERRQRLAARGTAPPPFLRDHTTRLGRLARAIHEQVHLGHVIEDLGVPLIRRGREFHCECIQCGGHDRFVIWPPPRSRGWCRQCGWSTDVIGFWQSWEQATFADTVLAVAERYLGMRLEDDR